MRVETPELTAFSSDIVEWVADGYTFACSSGLRKWDIPNDRRIVIVLSDKPVCGAQKSPLYGKFYVSKKMRELRKQLDLSSNYVWWWPEIVVD